MISITYVVCWITTILILGGITLGLAVYKCYKIKRKEKEWIPDDEEWTSNNKEKNSLGIKYTKQ